MYKTFLEKQFFKTFVFLSLVGLLFFSTYASVSYAARSCYNPSNDVIGKILNDGTGGVYDFNDPDVRDNVCNYIQVIANFESPGTAYTKANDDKDYCWAGDYRSDGTKQMVQYYPGDKPSSCIGDVNTAKGHLQFVDGTFDDTLDYIKNNLDPDFPVKDSIDEYTYEEQAQFAMAYWSRGKNGVSGAEAIIGIVEGDRGVAKEIYCKIHHTDCGGGQIGETRNALLDKNLEAWGSKGTIPDLSSGEGDINDYTINGVSIGTSISMEALDKATEKALAEICSRESGEGGDFGLVGFDGGICKNADGSVIGSGDGRTGFEALTNTIQSAINWVIGLAFMLAVAVFFWAGFLLLRGTPAQASKAKGILGNVIIGLVLIATAWLLVDWVFTLFGVTEAGYKYTSVG